MSSAIDSLDTFYCSFFRKCGKLTISPYVFTLDAFMGRSKSQEKDLVLGAATCIFFSTVVPILPKITAFTFVVAAFAACLAAASMLVTYPVAIFRDALSSVFDDESEYSFGG